MSEHDFALHSHKATCIHCGLTMAEWVNTRERCHRPAAAEPVNPVWDAVLAVALGTNAATPQEPPPCEP